MRTETVPLADPPLCVIVAVPPKFVPSLATSNPVGAVTVTFADKFAPVTVKVCAAEAVPAVVEKADKVETEGVTLGDEEEPAGVTSAQVLPILISSISIKGVAAAESCLTRTRFKLARSVPLVFTTL